MYPNLAHTPPFLKNKRFYLTVLDVRATDTQPQRRICESRCRVLRWNCCWSRSLNPPSSGT
uniref:Uncharacterized protein n=1 Tax=Anguilla anguilla TaxID=7936 RepID=A0A0E9X2T4_ANGAN